MKKYENVLLDRNGNVVVGATVTVQQSGVNSTVYAANAIGVNVNPIISDSDGFFQFYAKDGTYDLVIAMSGVVTETMSGIVLQDIYGIVSVLGYGATGNGTTDDTSAIAAAIIAGSGRTVYFPKGTYLITSQLSTTDGDGTIIKGDGKASVIKKGFNGAMLSLGKLGQTQDLYFDGNGSNFTGRGIIISTGSNDNTSFRRIVRTDIINTASYGIEFTQNTAGFETTVENCQVVPYNVLTVPAIKITTTGSEVLGNRYFNNVRSASNVLIDFGGACNTRMVGCSGGCPTMTNNSAKSAIAGCRFVSVSSNVLNYLGTSHNISATTHNVSGGVRFGTSGTPSDLQNFQFFSNELGGNPVEDFAGGAGAGDNQIWYNPAAFTPTFTAAGGGFVLGNATLAGRYYRRGSRCAFRIIFVFGSTSTIGSGALISTLPFSAASVDVGNAIIRDVSVPAEFVGLSEIGFSAWSGANQVIVMTVGAGQPAAGAGVPMTWASGDYMIINGEYEIA